jgi:hypothetical protein
MEKFKILKVFFGNRQQERQARYATRNFQPHLNVDIN